MTRSTRPADHDLIGCAQSAWKLEGVYPLENWAIGQSDFYTYVRAYAKPPRAKHRYHHIFLFDGSWCAGHYQYSLVGIAKGPLHKPVKFQGTHFTAGTVVTYFAPGQQIATPKNALDHERIQPRESTHQTCCQKCHTCGADLQHKDPDLLWCESCDTFR